MIIIKPLANQNYNNGFTVEGHAEFAPHGSDIVCSAVSASVALIDKQLDLFCDGETFDVSTEVSPGSYRADIDTYDKMAGYVVETLLQAFYDNMRQLEMQYPENIQVEEWIL